GCVMSAVNVIRNADGLTILTDGASYDADGVLRGVMSKVLTFPHMPAAIAMRGWTSLVPKVFATVFECCTFDELLTVVQTKAVDLGRGQRDFDLLIAGYSRARDVFEVYILTNHDKYEWSGIPAFVLTQIVNNCVSPEPNVAAATRLGWMIPALEDLDATRDG